MKFGERWRRAEQGNRLESSIVVSKQSAELRVADPNCVRQHRTEHRLKLTGRRTDHAKYFRGRCLLFQGRSQIGRALLDLLLQAGIGFLKLAGHVVELVGEAFDFVAGLDRDALAEIATADTRRAGADTGKFLQDICRSRD